MRISTRRIILLLLGLAVVGLCVWTALSLANKKPANPDDLLWRGIHSGLTARSVTCTTQQLGGSVQSKSIIKLDLASRSNAQATTTYNQERAVVTTEELTVASGDYIRYKSIQSRQNGKLMTQASAAKVIGIWSKSPRVTSITASLYGRSAYGNCIVPLAHLTDTQADQVVATLRDKQGFKDIAVLPKQQTADAEAVVYQATIMKAGYFAGLRQAASLAGATDAASLGGGANLTGTDEQIKISVGRDGRIQAVTYDQSQRSVRLTDYDAKLDLKPPAKSISPAELEQLFGQN